MRTLLAAALILVSAIAPAQDAPKPLSISLEPLGDGEGGVVARVFFVFANPRAITEAGLFLEGSFTQEGHVPRNFRFAVPRKGDKLIWNNTRVRNGRIVRRSSWAVLPDQRNEMAMVHSFAEGAVEIDVRLVLEADYGGSPTVVAKTTGTFTLAKTNRPYVAEADEDEEPAPVVAPEEELGAVRIHTSRRDTTSRFYVVGVDVLPPVKRVEYWIEDKKILARNAPPYTAELDLGDSPKGITLRATGFDAAGHYVDADACVVNADENSITVKITRTATPDGLTHFKLSVRNQKGTRLTRAVLYAGDRKLQEWDRPPFVVSVPSDSLEGVDSVRASVVDESGSEATDVQVLRAKRP